MRACLLLVVLLLVGGWTDEPPAWRRPGGRPINPVIFHRDSSFCRAQASGYLGRAWVAVFAGCMEHMGYIPVRFGIFP
jgi:hypothetical protein